MLNPQMKGWGFYELCRAEAEAAAQRNKPQPVQTVPQSGMTAFIGTSISRQIGGWQSSRSTRSTAILSGGPLSSALMPPVWRAGAGSGSPREWVFVRKCLLERKRSYLTEKGLLSSKA